jgi:hypothetical protein
MRQIKVEEVPSFVYWHPRTQDALDAEVAEAEAHFAKPGFGMTLASYHGAIAARKNSNMPLSIELWLISQRAEHGDFRPNVTGHHSIGPAVPPLGAAPRAIAVKEMTREGAARHLTKAEFVLWDQTQQREGRKA